MASLQCRSLCREQITSSRGSNARANPALVLPAFKKQCNVISQRLSRVQLRSTSRQQLLCPQAGLGDAECQGDNCLQEEDGSVIVRDDLDSLLQVLPADIRGPLVRHPRRASLLEVVLDMGRRPEARFLGERGAEPLREAEITREDLDAAVAAVGEFGGDNRAGVQGTLHRISAIRNRRGAVVGLTCRVGRAVTGHIDMIRDILDVPNSVLFLGRPGVGKTTVIREMARVLADELKLRVVIVDTSNEIGGDGDVPHPAIGSARRMQVPHPDQQHRVMIEAVENHTPQVVIIDEIGTEAEALACRTIAERGVQLIGTAHGQLLENLMKNPSLNDLVGGICSVTLGDEEARQRGTQKSVLERRAPPTFPLVIEMRERAQWVAHWVEDSVDCLLTGKVPVVQVRRRDPHSKRVLVEERKYDANDVSEGPASVAPPANQRESEVPDGVTRTVFDSMFGYSNGGFGQSFNSGQEPSGGGAGAGAYGAGWAARLRDYCDQDALNELSSMGFTDPLGQARRPAATADKFSFANGTGTSKGSAKGKRRNSIGRALSSHSRRR